MKANFYDDDKGNTCPKRAATFSQIQHPRFIKFPVNYACACVQIL